LTPEGKWVFLVERIRRALSQSPAQPQRRVHVAGVYDLERIWIFVDGKQQGEPVSSTFKPARLRKSYIGADPDPRKKEKGKRVGFKAAMTFSGLIEQVRISSVVRYRADFVPEQVLLPDQDTALLYRFEEGSGDVVRDLSGNGHHGAIKGAKWVKRDEFLKTSPAARPRAEEAPGKVLATPPQKATSAQDAKGKPASTAQQRAPQREMWIAEITKLGGRFLTKGYKATWSPDGKRNAVSMCFAERGGIGAVDVETGAATQLVVPGCDPAWCPNDGRLIACTHREGSEEEIRVILCSGGESRVVAEGGFASWSGDGKTLFFRSTKRRTVMCCTLLAEGAFSEPKQVPPSLAPYRAISPDGRRLAFDLRFAAGPEVWLIETPGTGFHGPFQAKEG
jgi:hypothetical protein